MGKSPVSVLLDLLFPPKCAFCGRLVEEGDVCAACAEALPFREGAASVQVIGEGRYPCALAFYYEGPVRNGVRALKFGKKSWRARAFARYRASLPPPAGVGTGIVGQLQHIVNTGPKEKGQLFQNGNRNAGLTRCPSSPSASAGILRGVSTRPASWRRRRRTSGA